MPVTFSTIAPMPLRHRRDEAIVVRVGAEGGLVGSVEGGTEEVGDPGLVLEELLDGRDLRRRVRVVG